MIKNRKGQHNKYKLVALDVDGTLITSYHIVSERTKEVLRALMKKGIKITIATGRFYPSVQRIAKEIPINAPLVSNDGALIKDVFSDETIHSQPLSLDIAKEIMDLLPQYGYLEIQVFMEKHRIYSGKGFRKMQLTKFLRFSQLSSLQGTINYFKDFIWVPLVKAKDLEDAKNMMDKAPAKLVVSGTEGQISALRQDLANIYGSKVFVTTAIPNCIDILDGDASKAHGLAVLTEKMGIKPEEVIAIGDNYNDIPMLEYAGLGIAMGNAPEEVKKTADITTSSNNEDGVAQVLGRILLDEKESFETEILRDCQ